MAFDLDDEELRATKILNGSLKEEMDQKIKCANCGREIKYGSSYSSMKKGAAVRLCRKCFNTEWTINALKENHIPRID